MNSPGQQTLASNYKSGCPSKNEQPKKQLTHSRDFFKGHLKN